MIDNCSKPQASLASTLTVLFLQITDRGKLIPDFFQTVKLLTPPGLLPIMAYMGRLHLKRVLFLGFKLLYERVRISLVEVDEKGREIYLFGLFKSPKRLQGSYKKLQPFLKDFSRTTYQEHNFTNCSKMLIPSPLLYIFQYTCLQSKVDYCIKQKIALCKSPLS